MEHTRGVRRQWLAVTIAIMAAAAGLGITSVLAANSRWIRPRH